MYTWVKTGAVRIKCLAKEHNTVSPHRTPTRTTQSVGEHTDHGATTILLLIVHSWLKLRETCEGNLMPMKGLSCGIK